MSNLRDDRYPVSSSSRYRRSPPDLNAHGSTFNVGQSGRTVLPPLNSGFASHYADPPHEPMPGRMSPGRSEVFSPSFPQGHWPNSGPMMAGHQPLSYSPFELDQRYPATSSQPPYSLRHSPGLPNDPNALRRVPPITIPQPRDEMWPGDIGHINSYPPSFSLMSDTANIHSPSSSYPLDFNAPYQIHPSTYPAFHGNNLDSRHLPPPYQISPDNHPSSHRLPEWGVTPSRGDSHLVSPYARNPPRDMLSSHSPDESSPVDFPLVKKKRKRADAAQLKILNEVYNRTAFPTTEERMDLAKKLDMSARSVQIWFQNKRQSSRQSRVNSNSLPPIMHHPYSTSSIPPPPSQHHVPDMRPPSREVVVTPGSHGSHGSHGSYVSRSPGDSSRRGLSEPAGRTPDPSRRGRSPEDVSSRSKRLVYH